MSQKMESNLYAIKHLRSGINSLLRSTVSGGTPPSLAGADMTTLLIGVAGIFVFWWPVFVEEVQK